MIRRHLIFLFIAFSSLAYAQSYELVYKKLLPGSQTMLLKSFPDNSGYMLPYSYGNSYNSDSIDIGIWTEHFETITVASNDTAYRNRLVTYDNQLNIINSLPLNTRANSGQSGIMSFQFAHASNLRSVLYYSNNKPPTTSSPYNFLSGLYTPFGNFVPNEPTQSIFIEHHAESNSLNELFSYTEPTTYTEPYPGYFQASYDQFALRKHVGQVFNILNDNTLVAYLNLYENQFIKTSSETIDYTSLNGQENLIRVEYDLSSGEILTQQIGSGTGSLSTFSMHPSSDLSNLYRIGLVRGNNTPISVSGVELEMEPSDSLYHVFITKEDATGQTQWITELYAYNNTARDTISDPITEWFGVRNQFPNIIEKNNDVFVSSTVKIEAVESDTLMYRDFLGQIFLYRNSVPIYLTEISGIPLFAPFKQIAFSESAVYKLDANGSVIKKLSHTNKLSGHELSIYYNQNGVEFKESQNLFEVNDKLAWVNYYYAVNDSVGEFTYELVDGSENTLSLDLPAGLGANIVWLDTDLNIVDNWVFLFQLNSLEDAVPYGMIQSVIPYNQDTLLIQGILPSGTTTNLDPSGISPDFTTQEYGSFVAFYADSETSGISGLKGENRIRIFPNPTNDVLNISGAKTNNSFYTVFDLSGRVVIKGKIANTQINIQGLKPGMYILSIESENGKGVEKFVVR